MGGRRHRLVLGLVGSVALTSTVLATAGGAEAIGPARRSPDACPNQWTVITTPSPGTYNRLTGVSGVSPSDTWAVGAEDVALAIHWDGQAWTQADLPSDLYYLNAVHAISSSDVWAVGDGSGVNAAHWNGAAWSAVDITPS